ncbi:hypothetical protein BDR04DRAFT_1137850 [Suillus decipiens]|nr:hypothetical protein BDR04DRAFT_1137850 [Suillus decipiens]
MCRYSQKCSGNARTNVTSPSHHLATPELTDVDVDSMVQDASVTSNVPSPRNHLANPELATEELYAMVREFRPLGTYDYPECEYLLMPYMNVSQFPSKIDFWNTNNTMNIFLALPYYSNWRLIIHFDWLGQKHVTNLEELILTSRGCKGPKR